MSRRTFEPGDRGRVPFALVGVVLVVTSALFATGVGRRAAPPEPAVDTAMERTAADARATLRQSVAAAAVAAASDPVVEPADTEWGAVLSDDRTFRDALAIRIYLVARDRFASIGRSHRGVTTTASLPGTASPAALARARDRVRVRRAGPDGAQLQVTVTGITQTARDGDRVVGRRNVTLDVRVKSPVLAVHDRVVEFQERLDAGLGEPGLTRRLTRQLYAVAWARGYAQYSGVPIENVVANRHVEVLTNAAVLRQQRAVFGAADPDGRRAYAQALAATALRGAGAAAGKRAPPVAALVKQGVSKLETPGESAGVPRLAGGSGAPSPNETITVRVGEAARHAFSPYVRPDATVERNPWRSIAAWLGNGTIDRQTGMNDTIQSVFDARVRTVGARRRVSGGRQLPPPEEPNGTGWTLVGDEVRTSVAGVANASGGPSVSLPEKYHALFEYQRRVTLRHERVRSWRRNGSVNETATERTETFRTTVAVIGRHAVTEHAPDRPIAAVHEPAGPFNGSNLADVATEARETMVTGRGGPDALAGAVARGTLSANERTFRGEWPAELRQWAYPGLVELRRTVANVSVEVRRGRVGTFETNPPAELAARLRARRDELLGAPATYDHVADKARVALRERYLDAVVAVLERRARLRERRKSDIADALSKHSRGSLSRLRRSLRARRIDGNRDDTGGLTLTVDGAPPYLTRSSIDHGNVAAVEEGATVHPLVTENVNVATVPYGDAVDTVLNGLKEVITGPAQTRLRTGAKALGSADSVAAATGNGSSASERAKLRDRVAASVETARRGIRHTLAAHGVGDDPRDRTEIVAAAFGRWDAPRERALAVSNRSVVDAVVEASAAHESATLTAMERDRLRLDLRDRLTRGLDGDRLSVPAPAVTAATAQVKSIVGDRVQAELSRRIQRRFNKSINRMPAGIPLAPIPGSWYATMNVWFVTVEGRYERFAVEAPRRTPAAADASLAYVRDGSNVTLDVDGDGSAELLGRADRISFRVESNVVVVVPPGKTGVGDVDGNMVEQSAGWPLAGPERRTPDRSPLEGDGGSTRLPPAARNVSAP